MRGVDAVHAGLLAGWSAAVYAQQTTFGADIASIPIQALAYVVALSLIGGLAPALRRIKRSDCHRRALTAGVAQDLVTSVVAGLLAFFVTESAGIQSMAKAATITGAGWGGARFMHRVLDGWMDRIFPPQPYNGPERRHNADKRHPPLGGRRETDFVEVEDE